MKAQSNSLQWICLAQSFFPIIFIIIIIIIIIISLNSNCLPADELEIEHVHIAFPVYVADKTFCKCFVIDWDLNCSVRHLAIVLCGSVAFTKYCMFMSSDQYKCIQINAYFYMPHYHPPTIMLIIT